MTALLLSLQEWIAAHKGKKQAYDADMERKQGIRDAVAPAAAAYEEAKKVLKKASADRRSAAQAAQDPPAPVSHLTFHVCRSHHTMNTLKKRKKDKPKRKAR